MTLKSKIRILAEQLSGYKILRDLPHGFDPIVDVKRLMKNKPMTLFFDVGAHVGESAKNIAAIYPDARIFCFEPMTDNFKRLTENTVGLNCKLHNVALGAKPGTASIMVQTEHTSMNSLVHNSSDSKPGPSQLIQVTTIDDFCRESNIGHIDYLKIDTEGFDLEVIKGATRMLKSSSVDFVEAEVSMNPTNTYHVSGDLVKKTMEDMDYLLFGIYEQALEWIVKKPILRRVNMLFIRKALADANTY